MTESAAVVTSGSAEVARANYSGIVPKDDHVQVTWFYFVCAVILVAMGIVIPLTVHDGPWLAVMSVMGSVIIVALLSAAAVPHLLSSHRH